MLTFDRSSLRGYRASFPLRYRVCYLIEQHLASHRRFACGKTGRADFAFFFCLFLSFFLSFDVVFLAVVLLVVSVLLCYFPGLFRASFNLGLSFV